MLNTTNSSPAVVTGQSIAKSDWAPRHRAHLAAKWRTGRIKVDPTVKLAASVFGVSVPLVMAAIADLESAATLEAAASVTNGSRVSDSTLEWMVRDAGTERVWAAIERQLELQV
jgi:hypothetical protein